MTTILYHHFPVQLSEVRRFNFDMGHVFPSNQRRMRGPTVTVAPENRCGALGVFWNPGCGGLCLQPFCGSSMISWVGSVLSCCELLEVCDPFAIEKRHQFWAVFLGCFEEMNPVRFDRIYGWTVSLESVAVVFLLAGASIFVKIKILLRYVCETFAKNVLAGLKPMEVQIKT